MDYTKLNQYKIPIIVGSVILSTAVVLAVWFYQSANQPPTFAELTQPILSELSTDFYLRGKQLSVRGMSVKKTNKGLFLVYADIVADGELAGQRMFLAQKFADGKQSYWTVERANVDYLKKLGISLSRE